MLPKCIQNQLVICWALFLLHYLNVLNDRFLLLDNHLHEFVITDFTTLLQFHLQLRRILLNQSFFFFLFQSILMSNPLSYCILFFLLLLFKQLNCLIFIRSFRIFLIASARNIFKFIGNTRGDLFFLFFLFSNETITHFKIINKYRRILIKKQFNIYFFFLFS